MAQVTTADAVRGLMVRNPARAHSVREMAIDLCEPNSPPPVLNNMHHAVETAVSELAKAALIVESEWAGEKEYSLNPKVKCNVQAYGKQ